MSESDKKPPSLRAPAQEATTSNRSINTDPAKKAKRLKDSEQTVYSLAAEKDLLSTCLGRLPFLGRVIRFDSERAFGFIEDGGNGLFFHISGRLPPRKERVSIDLTGQALVYATGSDTEGRRQAVQWALVGDIPWPNESALQNQAALEQIRARWLKRQDARSLLTLLRADWYADLFRNTDAPADLNDPLLEIALTDALRWLSAEEWERRDIGASLRDGHYSFIKLWSWNAVQTAPLPILREFSPEQLTTLGSPFPEWLGAVSDKTRPKLIEWAIRAAQDPEQSNRWDLKLRDAFAEEVEIVVSLLKSTWRPTKIGIELVQRLVAAKKLPVSQIEHRVREHPDEVQIWLGLLPSETQYELLIDQDAPISPEKIARHPAIINDPALGRVALSHFALSVDIESNGEKIWEIGTATRSGKLLLLSRDDVVRSSAEVVIALASEVQQSQVMIGHNILAWDWPILAKSLPATHQPIIWDTLLVSFMLEPWKPSHALGGSHRADEDAQEAFRLFEAQLETVNGNIATRLLSGEIGSTSELMEELAETLQGIAWEPPSFPADLIKHRTTLGKSQTLIVHPHWIKQLVWVPSVFVSALDDRTSAANEVLALSERLFETNLKELRIDEDPFAIALRGVLRKATADEILVTESMLPVWLRDRVQLDIAISLSNSARERSDDWSALAPYPSRATWYAQADFENLVFLDPPEALFLAEAGWSRTSDLPKAAQKILLRNGEFAPSGTKCIRLSATPRVDLWLSIDPAAMRLSSSGRYVRTIKTIDSLAIASPSIIRSSPNLRLKLRLLVRDDATLFPGAHDQASYWKSVIEAIRPIPSRNPPNTVHILLIGSSAARELVELIGQCLCQLNMATPYADHHSRSDRLRQASATAGWLVDVMESWPEWLALSSHTEILLCPVIECVPISDWFAAAQREVTVEAPAIAGIADFDEPDDEREAIYSVCDDTLSEDENVPLRADQNVSGAEIAARTTLIVRANLPLWMQQAGLAEHSLSCVILDPRISSHGREIRALVEHLHWQEVTISANQTATLNLLLEPLEIKREIAPSDYESMRAFLEKHWNVGRPPNETPITDFRENTQQPAIDAIRDRSADVLVALPTGEGKSVLFQVPSLCRGLRTRRLSIVISPLRALMRDQVDRLWKLGFSQSVDYLTSDRSVYEINDVHQGLLDHRIVLLYVAPERFRSRRFVDVLNRRVASDGAFEYVIFDEAHCVSQWGYEFRPDYFYALTSICLNFRSEHMKDRTPLLFFSATITAANREHLADTIRGEVSLAGARYLEFKSRPEQYFHPIRNHIEIHPIPVRGRINSRPKADWPVGPRLEVILKLIAEALENRQRTGVKSSLIVFAARRDHAEELCLLIGKRVAVEVEYFHAGLDSATREDVYERFRNGAIEILVATKAFGMGMDIPHIHWCVHVAPPTFLEDYLQEVGRIGRGEKERKDAALERLKATLLYSQEDFESNRAFIQINRLELRQISDLYTAIKEHSKLMDTGELVTLMPDAGFATFDNPGRRRTETTQIRKMLFWLERLERVEILATMPGLLPVKLYFAQLARIAKEESGPLADVASLLLSISQPGAPAAEDDAPTLVMPDREPRPGLDRIIHGLTRLVGLLLGAPADQEPLHAAQDLPRSRGQTTDSGREAVINLAQIWRATSLPHIDDVLASVSELESRNALKVTRKIAFSTRRHSRARSSEIAHLFDSLESVAVRIVSELRQDSQYIIDFEQIANALPATSVDGELVDVRVAFEHAVCNVLRSTGVRIRDRLNDGGDRELVAILPSRQGSKTEHRVRATVTATQALWEQFIPQLKEENKVIDISTLLNATRHNAPNRRFRESDLRRHLALLSTLKLISVAEPLVPMAYVLSVHRTGETIDESDHPDVWAELARVNRLTELRGDVLEIFVHLPVEARDQFIEDYFSQTDPEEMEAFLTEKLGQIDDHDAGQFIEGKREQLQAKAIENFLKRYQVEPEEPNQWRAISHPFDRNLLVNAGPGSGKTSVLIARLAHLIRFQHIRPEQILVLAFNRAVVFEIRTRIRDLFKKLGYATYVRRLDVATFHSYATRHFGRQLKDTDDWNEDRSLLLSRFADRLETDGAFRKSVTNGLRTVLVDEFQDVNEDIYRIIRLLSNGNESPVSVMAIGDDDQDILGWNRPGGEASDAFFRRFDRDNILEPQDRLELSVNFRSGPEIVEATQYFMDWFFRKVGGAAIRLKSNRLSPATGAASSIVQGITLESADFDRGLKHVRERFAKATLVADIAILCRTNDEVAHAYHALLPGFPNLEIQNSVSYPVSRMRHLGLWIDLLKQSLSEHGDRPLSEAIFETVESQYSRLNIPEVRSRRPEDVTPRQLWDLCEREASYPYLSHLIDFVQSLDSADIGRLLGRREHAAGRAVVSTIHKVKGLEFEEVYVLPSYSRFNSGAKKSLIASAAEEARLEYVAMTRAISRLTYFVGPREFAWSRAEVYEGDTARGKLLEGSPKEIGISWAWETTSFNRDAEATLAYILEQVRVGDEVLVRGRSLFHVNESGGERQIGLTANVSGAGGQDSALSVSGVLRCAFDGKQFFGGRTAKSVVDNGWGLVVLITGVLRAAGKVR